jgi:hypothetical protein
LSRTKSFLLFGSRAALELLLLFGCSLQLKGNAGVSGQEGWYIQLNVGAPATKGITVKEFEVTGLEIQVLDPNDALLQTINWDTLHGPQSYLIPVTQTGQHEIVVTHFGERDGEEVEATESAAFTIAEMVITVIDVVPGCIGVIHVAGGGEEPPAPSLVGVWSGANLDYVDDPAHVDMQQTYTADGYFEWLCTEPGNPQEYYEGSQKGTYTAADGILEIQITHFLWNYDPVTGAIEWVDAPPGYGGALEYTVVGDTLTIQVDLTGWGGSADTVWVLERQ